MNVSDWCEKNNLTVHAYYWRKRIETATPDKPEANKAMIFAELSPAPEPMNDTKTQLQISWNDLEISITNADTARLAAEFISQLQKRC